MKLFKDYAALAGGQVVSKLLGFLAFAWLARALDPKSYGAVEYIVGLAAFFTSVVEGGFGVIGVRRVAAAPAELPNLAVQIALARWLFALACAPAMAAFAAAGKSDVPASLVALFAVGLLTGPWRQDWLLQATERMNEAALAQVVRAVAFAVLVLVMVRTEQDLAGVGWAELASLVAMTSYCMYVQHTRITAIAWRGSFAGLQALTAEALVVGASNVVFTLSQYAPLVLVGLRAGGAETAWLGAALRVVLALLMFSGVYHYSLYPAVTRAMLRGQAELARLLAGSFRVTAWAGVLGALALTLFAEPLIVIAFGEKLAPAAPLVRVMGWMLPAALCAGHSRWPLVAAGAQGKVLAAQILGLATIVAVALVLARMQGGMGYAVAALAGALALWIVAHAFAVRARVHPPSLRLAIKPLLTAAIVIGIVDAMALPAWQAGIAFVLCAGAAPLIDRRLVRDIVLLGKAKTDLAPRSA